MNIKDISIEELRDKICEKYDLEDSSGVEEYVTGKVISAAYIHHQTIELGYPVDYADSLLDFSINNIVDSYDNKAEILSHLIPLNMVNLALEKRGKADIDSLPHSERVSTLEELGFDPRYKVYREVHCMNVSSAYNDGIRPYCGVVLVGRERTDKEWTRSPYATNEARYYKDAEELATMRNVRDWDDIADKMVEHEKKVSETYGGLDKVGINQPNNYN